MSSDTMGILAEYAQHRAYLTQRAGGTDQRLFVWLDDRWPSCPALGASAEHLQTPVEPEVSAVIDAMLSANPGTSERAWTRYLARISYCASICLHPDEAVEAVLHAEVGDTTSPHADVVRSHLEKAVNVLAPAGMLNADFTLCKGVGL